MSPVRRELPPTRKTLTRHFAVAGFEGYLHVDLYPDGAPGELRITMAKPGSTLRGLMDTAAAAISTGLQYGVPLYAFRVDLADMTFEPAGYTNDPDVQRAISITSYLLERLAVWFPDHATAPPPGAEGPPLPAGAAIASPVVLSPAAGDAPDVAQPAAPASGTTPVPPGTAAVAPPTHVVVHDLVVPTEMAEVVRRSFTCWRGESTSETWAAVEDGRAGGAGRPHHEDIHVCPRPWWAHGDRRAYCTCCAAGSRAGA